MKRTSDHLYINGVSVISKFGNNPEEFWRALQTPNFYDNRELYADIVSKKRYDNDYESYFIDMCVATINNAVSDAGLDSRNKKQCIVLGTGMALADSFLFNDTLNIDFMAQMKDKIKKKLNIKSGIIIIANACCAGAQAIAYGCDLIKTGVCETVIAGGAEAFSYITYKGFERLNSIDKSGCKPFDKKRKGIYIGDGASFFVLQSKENDKSYCKILGNAVANDAFHIVAPEPNGTQIKNAIRSALTKARINARDIDAIVAHGTGTKLNEEVEAKALYEIFGEIDLTAPKGKIGHTGGASGAFGVLTAVNMIKHKRIPPIINFTEKDKNIKVNPINKLKEKSRINNVLVNSFAFGGTNVVLICGTL